MELFLNFMNEYGTMILYAIIVAVGSWLGTQIKDIYERYVTDKQTKAVVETVVKAVEQLYHDMDGEKKYMKALDAAHEMLAAKGLTVSTLELQMLIEAAVSSFNYGFGGKKIYGEFEVKEGVMADGTEAETGAQE
jgi:hypothetical protein